jgi:hypothetical protein
MGNLVIWSDEILKVLKEDNPKKKIWAEIGNQTYPIIGLEDSQSVGWWEIRFGNIGEDTIDLDFLLSNLPKGEMVMLQEKVHVGKSYPINQVLQSLNGEWFIRCTNPDSEYWEELKKFKAEQGDNYWDELDKRKCE